MMNTFVTKKSFTNPISKGCVPKTISKTGAKALFSFAVIGLLAFMHSGSVRHQYRIRHDPDLTSAHCFRAEFLPTDHQPAC